MSRPSHILVSVLFLCILLPLANSVTAGDLEFSEIARLVSSDLGSTDAFGFSVAIDGDTMVVGALNANGPPTLTGAAYIFVRNQGGADGWQEVAKLTASDAVGNDDFGASVGIWGDFVVVGARESDQGGDRRGSAYVFERNTGGADAWGEVAKLTASDAADVDNFGDAVGIFGDTVVVGAPNAHAPLGDSGAAYVFGRNVGGADNWGEVTKLSGPSAFAYFGNAIAIQGDTIVVGSENNGTVHIHSRNEGGADHWGEVKVLTGSASSAHRFGASVSISGDRVVTAGRSVSAPGAAWIFDRNHGGLDNWGEIARVTASDGTTTDSFGSSISIDGDRMLVGARQADATGIDAGSAYMFERNEGGADSWGETQQILPSDPEQYDYFGTSVAIDGSTAVAGASANGGGAAYIFTGCGINSSDWIETAKTIANDGFSGHQYAHGVAFNGDIAVVGAQNDNDQGNSAGSAYILMQNQGGPDNWGELKKIYANDAAADHHFGERLDMSGDVIVVGVDEDDTHGDNSGAFYLFGRNEDGVDNWGQINKMTASDATAGAWFGYDIAIDDDTVVVGAIYDSNGVGTNAGAAYIFKRNEGIGTNWGEVAKLASDDLIQWDMFGYSVGISGDTVAVGAWRESDGSALESGAVYIFERNHGGADNWGQVAKLKASDAATNDYFGSGLAIDNDTVVVGMPGDDNVGFSSGSAYVFERNHGGADNWGEVAKLTASNASAGDLFGYAQTLAIEGDMIVIGSYKDEHAGIASGSVYVFERNAGGVNAWGETNKLVPSDQSYAQNFGNAVDLRSNRVMIGAVNDSDIGSVYFFDTGCPEFDFGDAPDPDYPTLLGTDGARHKLGGTVFLGATVDQEADGQPGADATGDDTDPEGDDEDGVTFTSIVVAGGTADVDVVASESCLLNAWMDFNIDGDWDDAGEQIFSDESLAPGTNSLNFAVPLDTNPGNNAIARFRVGSTSGLAYDGVSPDGEVEDHTVYLDELDFGDAPDPTYPTLLASDGARHLIGGSLFLGTLVDAEIDGLPTSAASGDDTHNSDDEDGFSIETLPVGNVASGAVIASESGFVNGWIDFNADGDWDDAGEHIFDDVALTAGTHPFVIPVPATAVAGQAIARIRIDSAGGLSPTGLALDGEVEDHAVSIVEYDFGDAPDPSYPTLLGIDGARHELGGTLYLGAGVDTDFDGQPTPMADGDDIDGNDDEDGVVFTSGIGAGLSASVNVTASEAGLLNVWIDFNADGDWDDADEHVFTDQALAAGVNPLSFSVPSGANLGSTYARFRLDSVGGLSPSGYADDGEVEDYMVEIVEGPDLQIEMTTSTETAPSGRPLTYTITVTNNGPLPATSVTVTDILPAEVSFISSTPGAPDCTLAGDTLTCDLGTMAAADTSQITIETVLGHPVFGTLDTTASVTAAETDPITANNTVVLDTRIAIFVDGVETGDLSAWD